MAQIDLEKKISQIHCTNTIFDRLENTICDLKAKLLEKAPNNQMISKEEGMIHDLELQISELKVQNQILQEDIQRLRKREPETGLTSPCSREDNKNFSGATECNFEGKGIAASGISSIIS